MKQTTETPHRQAVRGREGLMACLLKNEPASYGVQQVKPGDRRSHSESESEEGAGCTA